MNCPPCLGVLSEYLKYIPLEAKRGDIDMRPSKFIAAYCDRKDCKRVISVVPSGE